MSRKIVLLFVLITIAGFAKMKAQTKPSQTKPKTTKTAAKTSAKKTAPKEINVYVCTDDKDKFYHKRNSCAGLNKCGGEIKNIKSQAALSKYKKKKCPRCFAK